MAATCLCCRRTPFEVAGDEQVHDWSADTLGGQNQGQGPPEAQHLPDGGVSLETEGCDHAEAGGQCCEREEHMV